MLWQEDQTGEKEKKKDNSDVSTSMNYGAASFSAPKTTASFSKVNTFESARTPISPQGQSLGSQMVGWTYAVHLYRPLYLGGPYVIVCIAKKC